MLTSKLIDILKWNVILFLSLNSSLESIEINILPQMLYLFQTLPGKIPTKQFMEWDGLISRYLWQGEKSRIRYKTLQLVQPYLQNSVGNALAKTTSGKWQWMLETIWDK